MELFDLHTHGINGKRSIYNQSTEKDKAQFWYSMGIHPWELDEDWGRELEKMKVASQDPNLMAIGECGFDLIKGPEVKIQQEAFVAQLDWALELGLPVIMHQVKGLHLLQQIIKDKAKLPPMIWHGFNAKPQIGLSLLDAPIYFSFGKALFKSGSNAQEFLKICPLERIFLETDDSNLKIEQIFSQASLLLQIPVERLLEQVVGNWNNISKRKMT
ncbi:TatD family hydrolase [Belliella sp. R4-6]|uniref:TatD family hydrolase n=1 Tax=Belliella alkalica TaxID=1730871 RepID=A0ABS9V968_9BACT|nr:TatD family hydrolase [Belliella alkalica]MCH7412967.1 TatD family hydrolase [Belliella alkalica]